LIFRGPDARPRANHRVEPHPAQIRLEQLQPGIRRELDVIELQRQIPIDTGMQLGVFVLLSVAFRL